MLYDTIAKDSQRLMLSSIFSVRFGTPIINNPKWIVLSVLTIGILKMATFWHKKYCFKKLAICLENSDFLHSLATLLNPTTEQSITGKI